MAPTAGFFLAERPLQRFRGHEASSWLADPGSRWNVLSGIEQGKLAPLVYYLGNWRQGGVGARAQEEVAEARDVDVPQTTHHEAPDASVPLWPMLRGWFLLQTI